MGNFNVTKEYYTNDPSGHNDRKKSTIELNFSSVSDAGSIIINDGYRGVQEIHLCDEGLRTLIDILNELKGYSKFTYFE
jgi:hypothetical protein